MLDPNHIQPYSLLIYSEKRFDFVAVGQQEQVLEIPRQFLVKAPAPEPTSFEQRTPKMNPKSDSNFNSDSGSNSLPSQSAISVPSSIEEKA